MVTAAKRRFVAGLLALFAAWPLLHFGLVQRHGLDPWKFGGWAMYTQPSFLPKVEVFELRDGARVKLPLLGSRLEPAADEVERLRVEALQWGRLVDTKTLAVLSRAGLGTRDPLEIVITRFFIDPRSARLTTTRKSFLYSADQTEPISW